MLRHIKALLQIGSRIGLVETLFAYILPFLFLASSAVKLKGLMVQNMICQIIEFSLLVQLPLAITGKMAYVDLGWPLGLVILGINGFTFGDGWWIRRCVVNGFMILHGARMFMGMNLILNITYFYLIYAKVPWCCFIRMISKKAI